MKPKRIILIRHGESEGNVNKKLYGQIPDYALELTPKGEKQAFRAGQELREIVKNESLFFYVSPSWRTRGTFEQIIKGLDSVNFDYIEEPRIREQEWGHLRNLEECFKVELQRDSYGTFYYRIPDGESGADVFDRISGFLGTMYLNFEKEDYPENTVIITHGMSIRLFLMHWFHWTVEEFEVLAIPKNCEIVTLEKNENDKYVLLKELRKHESIYHTFQRPIKL